VRNGRDHRPRTRSPAVAASSSLQDGTHRKPGLAAPDNNDIVLLAHAQLPQTGYTQSVPTTVRGAGETSVLNLQYLGGTLGRRKPLVG
jgi:hypothetical protein